MKLRVALGSGGLKGAYQYGFFKTLEELDEGKGVVEFDRVHGASIGSLNAPFVAAGKVCELSTIWEHRDPIRSVMHVEAWHRVLGCVIPRYWQFMVFVLSRGFWYKRYDAKVFKDMWERLCVGEEIARRGCDVACVAYDVGADDEIWVSMVDAASYYDGVCKSAALPILLPYNRTGGIGGGWYMDGGLTEDVPTTRLWDADFDGLYLLFDNGIELDEDFSNDLRIIGSYDKLLSVCRRYIKKKDSAAAHHKLPTERTFTFSPRHAFAGESLFAKQTDLDAWIAQGVEDAKAFYVKLVDMDMVARGALVLESSIALDVLELYTPDAVKTQ